MIPPTGPFPRRRRIRRSREFRELARRGSRRSTEAFVVFDAPTQGEGEGRLGITVSRRVGNAVVRNRVKRSIREWYRRTGTRTARLDLLVIARPPASRLDVRAAGRALDALVGCGP